MKNPFGRRLDVGGFMHRPMSYVDARYAVDAINRHEKLVAMLRIAYERLGGYKEPDDNSDIAALLAEEDCE